MCIYHQYTVIVSTLYCRLIVFAADAGECPQFVPSSNLRIAERRQHAELAISSRSNPVRVHW